MPGNATSIDLPKAAKAYYAPATVSSIGQTIQISGQVGTTANGKAPSSYESQIHLALLNLRKVLAAAEATVTDITKLTLYIVNYDPQRRLHTKHLQRLLGTHRPAMTLVPVTQLAHPDWLFEIDAVVVASPGANLSPAKSLADIESRKWVDVAVIGAGLSGLAAAHGVTAAGLSCVVLEARDRVGGKTWSRPLAQGGGIVDVGAAWINDSNQTRMIALARKYNADLIEQNTIGNCVLQDADGSTSPFPYGELPMFDEKTRTHLAEIRDMCEAHCQKLDVFSPQSSELDSLTFEAYLRKNGASEVAVATSTIWTRAMLGQEPSDISALFFLNYCKSGGGLLQMRSDRKHGAQYLRVRQGTQHFSLGMAKDLPAGTIRLSTPVDSIRHIPGGVEIKSTRGDLYARKVILSVPTPVLKTFTFEPPLPQEKSLLVESYTYGYYTKAMMVFKKPFWLEKGFCGLAQSFYGPASVIRDTSVPQDGKWILTCFLVGAPGRQWAQLTAEGQTKALLKQIGELFSGKDATEAEFSEIISQEWTKEKYSGWGCPCTSLPPGVLDSVGHMLREPVGDIHFVGTETAGEWKGYMEGAVRSGERGAAEVVNILSFPISKI